MNVLDGGRFVLIAAGGVAANEPHWADIITAFGSLLAGAGLVVAGIGAWFAVKQLDETRRDREIQLIAELGRRWDDDRMAEARDKQLEYTSEELCEEVVRWLEDPKSRDSQLLLLLLRVPNFFEDLAVMVESGGLDIKLVDKAFRALVLTQWSYWEQAIVRTRELREPEAYVEFEKLKRQLEELAKLQ
jgi:hypothetical protein